MKSFNRAFTGRSNKKFIPVRLLPLILVCFECTGGAKEDVATGAESITGKRLNGDPTSGIESRRSGNATGCVEGDCENGYGVYVYNTGDRYSGNFSNGVRNGNGEFDYANGDRFKGSYANDLREGAGTYYYANNEQFKGNFSSGNPSGAGEYVFSDGKIYRGEFTDMNNSKSGMLVGGSKERECEIRERKLFCN